VQSDKPTETDNTGYVMEVFAAHIAGCLGIIGFWWAADRFLPNLNFGLIPFLLAGYLVWLGTVLGALWLCYRREAECRRKATGALMLVLVTSPLPLGLFTWGAKLASAPF